MFKLCFVLSTVVCFILRVNAFLFVICHIICRLVSLLFFMFSFVLFYALSLCVLCLAILST